MNSKGFKLKVVLVVSTLLMPIALFYISAYGGIRGVLLLVRPPNFSTFKAEIDEFELGNEGMLKTGPNGSMWVAVRGESGHMEVGRIGPTGIYKRLPIKSPPSSRELADGRTRRFARSAWFIMSGSNGGRVVQVNNRGASMPFELPKGSGTELIQGIGENLWFTATGYGMGSISSSGQVANLNLLPDDPNLSVRQLARIRNDVILAAGRNGLENPVILRIDRSGQVRTFILPQNSSFGAVNDLSGSPDGTIWFSMETDPLRIGLIDSQERVQSFVVPSPPGRGSIGDVGDIVAGPDGNLWFRHDWETTVMEYFGQGIREVGMIGRVTPKGKFDRLVVPTFKDFSTSGIAVGTDRTIWYGHANGVGRIEIPSD